MRATQRRPRGLGRYIFTSRSAHVGARERSAFILPFPFPINRYIRRHTGHQQSLHKVERSKLRVQQVELAPE
jgi:hypothetical protein